VLLGWALVLGLVDRLTWGGWFHSALAYWRYNWVEGKGALFGASPASYYLRVLWTSMPTVTVVVLPAALLGLSRAPRGSIGAFRWASRSPARSSPPPGSTP
jgi:hypothetical protein